MEEEVDVVCWKLLSVEFHEEPVMVCTVVAVVVFCVGLAM
jgi:hypothetical protein